MLFEYQQILQAMQTAWTKVRENELHCSPIFPPKSPLLSSRHWMHPSYSCGAPPRWHSLTPLEQESVRYGCKFHFLYFLAGWLWKVTLHLWDSTHLFPQHVFIEGPLCADHCSRHRTCSGEQDTLTFYECKHMKLKFCLEKTDTK